MIASRLFHEASFKSFLFLLCIQVQPHYLERLLFVIQCVSIRNIWLLNRRAQCAFLPLITVSLLPVLFRPLQRLLQVLLILCMIKLVLKARQVTVIQVSIVNLDIARTFHQYPRFFQVHSNPQLPSQKSPELIKQNPYRAHIMQLLELDYSISYQSLFGKQSFAFQVWLSPIIPGKVLRVLGVFTWNKAGSNFVVMHAQIPLIEKIFGNIEVGLLGCFEDLGLNLESKSSEISEAYSPASKDVFFDVISKNSDHKVELRFIIYWFNRLICCRL